MRIRRLGSAVTLMLLAGAPAAAAQGGENPPAARDTTSTLAGVVRDSLGHGLSNVEVLIPDGPSTRTDSAGRFVLTGIAPGQREVWFRRLGFTGTRFAWNAQADVRVDVLVPLRLLPHMLDPVLVRAREERAMRSRSSIAGRVVDESGVGVPNVEVQVVGASQVTRTRADGSFSFPHVFPGHFTLLARRMGFRPNTVWMELGENDQRDVTIRVRELPERLNAVQITDLSGYGDESAWRELDQRQNFRSAGLSAYLGPDVLRDAKYMSLDELAPFMFKGPSELQSPSAIALALSSIALPSSTGKTSVEGGACILENGTTPRITPLTRYWVSDLEAVEYYAPAPPESDVTHTIQSRFGATRCGGTMDVHPAYWVVWLKRSPRDHTP